MPLWRLFYHLVWATHERQSLISPAHEQILYPYIKGKADFLGCQLHAIGGTENHVHLIVSIPPKLSISDFAKRIKGSSSRYLNQEFAIMIISLLGNMNMRCSLWAKKGWNGRSLMSKIKNNIMPLGKLLEY
jgi:REP element-mobilizing transposase RayT